MLNKQLQMEEKLEDYEKRSRLSNEYGLEDGAEGSRNMTEFV